MVKVAGIWELGWSTPIMEYDLWAFVAQDFGVDEWIMSPVSGIKKPRITEVPDIFEFIKNENPEHLVFVDEQAETDLDDFEHPKDATYILGITTLSPWVALKKQGNAVKIPTPVQVGGFWGHQAIGIVLYDRLMKSK